MTQDTNDAYEIVYSPLERTLSGEGHTLRIAIYRGAHEPDWILEIEDERGTSTVFDERFASDQAALDAALAEIAAEGGMHRFCANAQAEAMASEGVLPGFSARAELSSWSRRSFERSSAWIPGSLR